MEKIHFLKKYGIDHQAFTATGLLWENLAEIANDYDSIRSQLESLARYGAETLMKCDSVHSINYRVKDREHLIEKIIRKSIQNPVCQITRENYRTVITDLIGIRALHLFKEEWTGIHEYISQNWVQLEKPTAYVRFGDSERILQYYRDKKCELKEHKYGYRSVHYLVETTPNRNTYNIEIQVRTIFEEAWGEIDHRIRYPYDSDNELYLRLSSILNRLAGNADEMASLIRFLKRNNDEKESVLETELAQKEREIEILRARLAGKQPEILEEKSPKVEKNKQESFPWLEDFMQSKLAQGLKGQIDQFIHSEYFTPIEISETDMKQLSRVQEEMKNLLGNPLAMKNFLDSQQQEFPMLEVKDLEERSSLESSTLEHSDN